MSQVRFLVAAFTLATLCGCGSEQPEQTGGTERAAKTQGPTARDQAVIRYYGMPHSVRLDAPYEGMTTLDPETGLPRRTGGCMVRPGEDEQIAAHNARVRAACARGELQEFQLKHKFTRPGDLAARFDKEHGAILAPGKPIDSSDHTYRIEVRLDKYLHTTEEHWQGYVHARGEGARRLNLSGKVGEEWRVLFDHEDTTLLVRKGDEAFQVHDLPTRELVQRIGLP